MHYATTLGQAREHLYHGDYAQRPHAAIQLLIHGELEYLRAVAAGDHGQADGNLRLAAHAAQWALKQPAGLVAYWREHGDAIRALESEEV